MDESPDSYEAFLERASERGTPTGPDAVLAAAFAASTQSSRESPGRVEGGRGRLWVTGVSAAAALLIVAFVIVAVSRDGSTIIEVGPSSEAPGATARENGSSVPRQATRSCVPDPSVFPVDLAAQPVPQDPSQWPPDQGIVMGDQQVASTYGAEHPDDFSGTVNLHYPERVAVAFTRNLDQHRAALLALVEHPDRLVVVKGCATEAEVRRIQSEATTLASSRGVHSSSSSDAIGGFVEISLRAKGEATARELVDRYGETIAVTLGTKRYPLGSAAPIGWYVNGGDRDPCALSNQREDPMPGLEIVPVPESSTIRSGEDFAGMLRVTNTGTTPIVIDGGGSPETAVIVERGTRNVVAVFTGGIAGVGWGAQLAPGESAENAFIGATGDCRPDKGFTLAPGEYGLIVPVSLGYERDPNGQVGTNRVQWSTEVPITIIP